DSARSALFHATIVGRPAISAAASRSASPTGAERSITSTARSHTSAATRALHSEPFHAVVRASCAGGIRQSHLDAVHVDRFLDRVPRRARRLRYDRAV